MRLISLPRSRKKSYKDVSTGELGDVESLLWVIFLDCCICGELATGLDLFVGHGRNVVRN